MGIGTINPTSRLDVNGTVNIDSTLIVHDSLLIQGGTRTTSIVVDGITNMRDNVAVQKDLTVEGISTFKGTTNLIGNVFFPNAPSVQGNLGLKQIVFFDPVSGKLETSGFEEISNILYSKECDIINPNSILPTWKNGPGKLYPSCTSTKVGIGTENPAKTLNVVGESLFQGNAQIDGNVGVGGLPNGFSLLKITNSTAAAGFEINQTGNLNQFNKLLLLEYDNPSTEIIKVVNTATNNVPFFLEANGKLTIHNGVQKIFQLNPDGVLQTRTVKVDVYNWPDFVFEKNYDLMPISELEKFIIQNNHLPEVPSATTVETSGLDLAEINKILLKKIEELTLYLIEQDKRIENLENR